MSVAANCVMTLPRALIIFRQHAHDLLGCNACRKRGEASQVAEYDDDFRAAAVQHAVIARSIDKVGDLGREESLELRYALLVLLRQRQLGSHFIKTVCKPLKLVPGLNRNAVVEGPGTDPSRCPSSSTLIGSVIRCANA